MKAFNDFIQQLDEHIVSIGLKPEHEKFREKYRDQIHSVLQTSYKKVDGGYSGLGSGTKEESDAIHDDISKCQIKATVRHDKVSAVSLYKNSAGRKLIAIGTDGTDQGKKDFIKTHSEDHNQKRAWGEYSGAPEAISRKLNHPVVSNQYAAALTKKDDIEHEDDDRYSRKIGNARHSKIILGHPKLP